MRTLIIHTEYQHLGGEDTVVSLETELLKENNEVRLIKYRNLSGLSGLFQFILSVWNFGISRQLKKKINDFKPDVIHIHNWHFASGPIIVRTAHLAGVPVVMTLHNYRLVCPSAILMNNGALFLDSINERFPWKAVSKKVYRNSAVLTFWLAFIVWFHKKMGTWNMVDRYIVLTDFAKDVFVQSKLGIPDSKWIIKPNFVQQTTTAHSLKKEGFVFVGRLSEEKGVRVLLNAFSRIDVPIVIIGDGELKSEVLEKVSNHSNIKYLGSLKKDNVFDVIHNSEVLIVPSTCFEGMPMAIIEAFSVGKPVIASKLGAMSTMIQDHVNGLHFEVGNEDHLIAKINYWIQLSDAEKNKMGIEAQKSYQQLYAPENNLAQLLTIYQSAIKDSESTTTQH